MWQLWLAVEVVPAAICIRVLITLLSSLTSRLPPVVESLGTGALSGVVSDVLMLAGKYVCRLSGRSVVGESGSTTDDSPTAEDGAGLVLLLFYASTVLLLATIWFMYAMRFATPVSAAAGGVATSHHEATQFYIAVACGFVAYGIGPFHLLYG